MPESRFEDDEGTPFFTIRLLESGDSADLQSLFSQCSEREVHQIFKQRGRRQIDHRSRAFWSLVFGEEPPKKDPAREALWLL
jgi:hypothetical protein